MREKDAKTGERVHEREKFLGGNRRGTYATKSETWAESD